MDESTACGGSSRCRGSSSRCWCCKVMILSLMLTLAFLQMSRSTARFASKSSSLAASKSVAAAAVFTSAALVRGSEREIVILNEILSPSLFKGRTGLLSYEEAKRLIWWVNRKPVAF